MSPVEKARELLAAGQAEQAIAELDRGAASGDPESLLELGIVYLAGKHVVRDLARAREYFRRAGEAGDPTARRIHISFVAIGVGADPDWAGAVDRLRDFSGRDAAAAQQVALIDQMALSPEGDPTRDHSARPLSTEPWVRAFDRLFSPDECAYLIARSQPLLQPSVIVDPDSGELRPHPVRTSYSAVFPWVSEDLVIRALNRRIAAVSETAVAAGEPLQVLRYHPGQQFRPHFDAFDTIDNQRVQTMLVYLNEGFEGGETVFTHNGLTFAGRTGDGLLFRNATPDGGRDETSQHAGLPVIRGEKFLASRWIRERPIVPS